MKQLRLALFALLACFLLASCSVETEMYLDKDFGGSQMITMDMESMMDVMSSMGGGDGPMSMDDYQEFLNDPTMSDSIADMEAMLNEQFAGTGASNFNIAFGDDGKVQFGFEFASLETFEKMDAKGKEASGGNEFAAMFTGMSGSVPTVKGKWVSIPLGNNDDMQDLLGEMGGDEGESDEMAKMMMDLMGESMRFKMTYSFEREIKKIKSDIPYTQVGNSVVMDLSLDDIMKLSKEKEVGELCIKLK